MSYGPITYKVCGLLVGWRWKQENTNRNRDSLEDSIVSNTKDGVYHILSSEYIPWPSLPLYHTRVRRGSKRRGRKEIERNTLYSWRVLQTLKSVAHGAILWTPTLLVEHSPESWFEKRRICEWHRVRGGKLTWIAQEHSPVMTNLVTDIK